MVWVTLALGMLLMAGLLIGTTVVVLGRMILRPPRMSDGRAMYILKRLSPEDLGIPYEKMHFEVRENPTGQKLKMAAWWMQLPHRSDRTVIFIHGYADAKVGAIAWASLWRESGWNILAIDLRAHGESEGDVVTGGLREREDIAQIIDELRLTHPDQTRHLALFGVSFGASIAAQVAAHRNDLAGVVMDSPYLDYHRAVMVQMQRNLLPLVSLHGLVVRWIAWHTGTTPKELSLLDNLAKATCPTLMFLSEDDQYVPPDDRAKILQHISAATSLGAVCQTHVFPQAQHNLAYATDPDRYKSILIPFLLSLHEAAAREEGSQTEVRHK